MVTEEKQTLIDAVIEDLKKGFAIGDYTVLDELLGFVPTENLIESLPEDEWSKFKTSRIIKGTFTSVWDDGVELNTPAELDEKTGEVFTPSIEATGVTELNEEFFTDQNGKQYEICRTCHTFILKTEMVERIGKSLIERTGCTDEHCDNFIEYY
jgi:hypothetical protein